MADNLRLWNAVCKTDPKHTKGFKRAGGFQGTAIKPIWLTKRLTEQFGPAGTGWGMNEPQFNVVPAPDAGEILVFCTVALWYRESDAPHVATVYGVGGDKVMGKNKYGPFANDEAFKASYTDALSNAMKQIGMGADIHMGMFEDEKYVRETTREFANGTAPSGGDNPDDDIRANVRPDAICPTTGELKSAYQVDKRKAAIAAGWKTTNKTYKGCVDQIFAYIDMAGAVEEVSAILNSNEDFIAKAEPIDKEEIGAGAGRLMEWLEKQANKAKAA